jgi:hypothetical protein
MRPPKASTSGLDTAVFNPVTPAEVTGNSVRPMVTSAALPLPRATRLGLLWIPVVCIAIGGGAAAWMQLGASRTETSTDAQTEAKGNRLVTLPEEPKPPVEEVIEQERLPGPPTEPEPPQELEPQSGSPGGSLAERGKRALLAGDFERAERLLTRCVEKYDRPDCHRSLAIAYQQRGDWRKVITHIRRYLVLVPEPVDKPQLQELLRSAEAQAQTKRPGDPPSPATAKRIAVSLIGSGPYGVGLIFVELDGKPWPKGHRSASPSQLSLSEGTHTLRYHRRDNPQTQLVRFQVVPAERVIDIEAITARPDE